MARATTKRARTESGAKPSTRRSASAKRKNGNGGAPKDAIALLKADHREVESLFEQFEKARSDDRKLQLAHKICTSLRVHATIEEEIFYPAFLEATDDDDLHHEAAIEHDGAKYLIAQIEESGPADDYYDAKVSVLSEMIKHHVKEEEQAGGMFAKARGADMDLEEIGMRMKERKDELMSDESLLPKVELGMNPGLLGSTGRSRDEAAARRV